MKNRVKTLFLLAALSFAVLTGWAACTPAYAARAEGEGSRGLREREYYRSLPVMERLLAIADDYAKGGGGPPPVSGDEEVKRPSRKPPAEKSPEENEPPGHGRRPNRERSPSNENPPSSERRPSNQPNPDKEPAARRERTQEPPASQARHEPPPQQRHEPRHRRNHDQDSCETGAGAVMGIMVLFAASAISRGRKTKRGD
ncbi:MAG: hypothetical protein FWE55_00205 [Synergistaceae bacterium]|nr:hypothetical protein [Synergistaceae bacterium]